MPYRLLPERIAGSDRPQVLPPRLPLRALARIAPVITVAHAVYRRGQEQPEVFQTGEVRDSATGLAVRVEEIFAQ